MVTLPSRSLHVPANAAPGPGRALSPPNGSHPGYPGQRCPCWSKRGNSRRNSSLSKLLGSSSVKEGGQAGVPEQQRVLGDKAGESWGALGRALMAGQGGDPAHVQLWAEGAGPV